MRISDWSSDVCSSDLIADRVVVMRYGEVVESGTAQEVLYNPQHDYTKMLIAAVPRLTPRAARPLAGAPVLDAKDLSKLYVSTSMFKGTREIRAVDGVNLSLYQGQTLGIVGESGDRKSAVEGQRVYVRVDIVVG